MGDLNLFHATNLNERFYSGKTRALHGTHITTGERMVILSLFASLWRRLWKIRSIGTAWMNMGSVHDVIERAVIPIRAICCQGINIIIVAIRT